MNNLRKRKEGKVPQLQEFCCIEVYFSQEYIKRVNLFKNDLFLVTSLYIVRQKVKKLFFIFINKTYIIQNKVKTKSNVGPKNN